MINTKALCQRFSRARDIHKRFTPKRLPAVQALGRRFSSKRRAAC